jgi:hypothetical protein
MRSVFSRRANSQASQEFTAAGRYAGLARRGFVYEAQ